MKTLLSPVHSLSCEIEKIKIMSVSIDLYHGPIGISSSGGADSSILLYILMKYAKGPIHVFACGNGRTNFQETLGSLTVLNWCINKTNRKDVFFHAHWVDFKQMHNMFNRDLIKNLDLSMIYTGFTKAPPEDAIIDFDREASYGEVEKLGVVHPTYYEKGKIYSPFANINKKVIATLYKELEVEELYSVTRSCENLKLIAGHCGKCWWCKERIWGFGRLE